MREAIGGSWIVYIAVIFIMIYIFFIGFVMNYASAYRAANYVITQIENCQGDMIDCTNMTDVTTAVKSSYGYSTIGGRNISPICVKNGSGVIYRVELPVEFDLPLLGGLRWVTVKAETKTIQGRTCSD